MTHTSLSKSELERYSRHVILPEFNIEGQLKLKNARVLVVGAGGLGAPLLLYLAAAGVGKLGIVDFDTVDESNLQRQVLFTTEDIGKSKAEVACQKLRALNPHIDIQTYNSRLTSENALQVLENYEVIADGTDNFATRYLVNDACILLGKVNVYASIFRFEGQVSVFNYLYSDGTRGPNYRDVFPEPPPPESVPSCAEGGVLGVLPGIIGAMQANEVIKVVSGVGEPLSGRLFLFDAASFESRLVNVHKMPENPLTGNHPTIHSLIDYDEFCHQPKQENKTTVPSVSVHELARCMKEGVDIQLIDVREPAEYAQSNIQGNLMPAGQIYHRLDEVSTTKKVIIHCRTGTRSQTVVQKLRKNHGYDNVFNLEGGLLKWVKEMGL